MAKDDLYHAKDGTTSPLDTADKLASALSDLSERLLALETQPHPATAEGSTGSGATDAAVARLTAVLEPYFGGEFIAYDRDHAPVEPVPGAVSDGGPSTGQQGTTGNGQAAGGGANN